MFKMRIPVREQLGALVLLASLIGLAVIAIPTWVGFAFRDGTTDISLT
jgi:osomolarity two-component system, sensor histidine kinase SLN1